MAAKVGRARNADLHVAGLLQQLLLLLVHRGRSQLSLQQLLLLLPGGRNEVGSATLGAAGLEAVTGRSSCPEPTGVEEAQKPSSGNAKVDIIDRPCRAAVAGQNDTGGAGTLPVPAWP